MATPLRPCSLQPVQDVQTSSDFSFACSSFVSSLQHARTRDAVALVAFQCLAAVGRQRSRSHGGCDRRHAARRKDVPTDLISPRHVLNLGNAAHSTVDHFLSESSIVT